MIIIYSPILRALCFYVLMLMAAPAMAQPAARWDEVIPEAQEEVLRKAITEAISKNDWMAAMQIADRYRASAGSNFANWQSFVYAMVGRPDLVAAMQEEGFMPGAEPCEETEGLVYRDALEAIAEATSDQQIIILQEWHWEVHHRLLLHALLPLLREQGFSYLAVEDFQDSPAAYQELAYPGVAGALHSSREPIFADAIRRAIELEYRLVPYEISQRPPEGIGPEEIQQWRVDEQANHLYERIFAVDPKAKVLIFSGWGHARKRADGDYIPMALRLKERTAIDPFTIDQTVCRLGRPLQTSVAVIPFEHDGSAVVQDFPAGTFDLQIWHSSEAYLPTGRAQWLMHLGRKPIEVPDQLRRAQEPVVIEARLSSESDDATPFDRLYLAQGEQLPLMLPSGEYQITVQADTDEVESMVLSVE